MLIDVISKYPGEKLELYHHTFEVYMLKKIAQINLRSRGLQKKIRCLI